MDLPVETRFCSISLVEQVKHLCVDPREDVCYQMVSLSGATYCFFGQWRLRSAISVQHVVRISAALMLVPFLRRLRYDRRENFVSSVFSYKTSAKSRLMGWQVLSSLRCRVYSVWEQTILLLFCRDFSSILNKLLFRFEVQPQDRDVYRGQAVAFSCILVSHWLRWFLLWAVIRR